MYINIHTSILVSVPTTFDDEDEDDVNVASNSIVLRLSLRLTNASDNALKAARNLSEANELVRTRQEYGIPGMISIFFNVYVVPGLPSPRCLREGLSQCCALPVGEWSRCHTRPP
mgnify:CR=1 FL=1